MGAIYTLTKVLPALLGDNTGKLAMLVAEEKDPEILQLGLRTLSCTREYLGDAADSKLIKCLHGLALEGPAVVRKLALRCMHCTARTNPSALRDVSAALQKQLVVGARGTPALLGTLKGLQTVFDVHPQSLKEASGRVLKFVETDVLKYFSETRETGLTWSAPPYECVAWEHGIKLLVAYLLHIPQTDSDVQKYVKLLFGLLKCQNDGVACISTSRKSTSVFKGVVKLLQSPQFRRAITPTHLRLLMVLNVFDGNEHAREEMRTFLWRHLCTGRLIKKYCWMLIVNALDHDKRHAAIAKDQVLGHLPTGSAEGGGGGGYAVGVV